MIAGFAAFVAFGPYMCCASPRLDLVESKIHMCSGSRLRTTRFRARREAALVITIHEFALRASLRFTSLTAIVATGLVSVLFAEPYEGFCFVLLQTSLPANPTTCLSPSSLSPSSPNSLA